MAIAEVALPAASLFTALVAVSFWRRQPEGRTQGRGAVDRGVLVLSGAQLAGVQLEGGDLVIDVFGGAGRWSGYAGTELQEEGQVAGTPMLTFRASFERTIDLAALEQLQSWTQGSGLVEIVVEVDGDTPLRTPTRITIGDGARALALLTAPAG